MLSNIFGWLGLAFMVTAAIPQLRNVDKVSKTTYAMLMAGQTCYLVRAISIHETVWVVSNLMGLITIFMVWRKLK
jgi:hypothetical protein